MMSDGRDANKGLTKGGNKSKIKKDKEMYEKGSNMLISSNLCVPQHADPNKGQRYSDIG